jgi:hypothetical protein
MTRTIHLIAETDLAAVKVAALIASSRIPDLYPDRENATRSLQNYPLPMQSRYRVYETRWTGFKIELSKREERP